MALNVFGLWDNTVYTFSLLVTVNLFDVNVFLILFLNRSIFDLLKRFSQATVDLFHRENYFSFPTLLVLV